MGLPLTIQPDDDARLLRLKKPLGAKTKVEVLRLALDTLDNQLNRQKKIRRWARATKLVSRQSKKVNKEFQAASLFRK